MIYCKKCGTLMEDNSKFCSRCGSPIDRPRSNNSKQMLMRFKEGDFQQLSNYLSDGWIIDDFKPTDDGQYIWTYVLLHKD